MSAQKAALLLFSLGCTGVNLWLIHGAGGWLLLGKCLGCGMSAQLFASVAKAIR